MAVEGISGAAATYQTTPATKLEDNTFKQETVYKGSDGTVNELTKDTSVVDDTSKPGDNSANNKEQDGKQPSEQTMKQTISDINKKLNNTECIFGIHKETNRVMIQIVDKDTKEVIKELPPEKTLDMIAKAWELAGIMVDEKL